jgi:hypothetical protein
MNPTIRLIAAMLVAALVFEETIIARAAATKPPKVHVTRPTSPPLAKPVKGPTIKTAKSVKPVNPVRPVKPVKPVKLTTTKSTKPTAKVDARLAKSTAKADARLAKSTVKTDAKVAKSTAKADAKIAKGSSSTTAAGGTTSETPATTPTHVVVSNPVADKISRNPKLTAKIEARLPTGITLAQASTGFKNQGQFMAAVNVSRNLGIDFGKLQTAMTGQTVTVDPATHAITTTTTGVAPLSLGQSIQKLKPGVDADAAIATAQAQTTAIVQTTSTTTPTAVTTTSVKTKGKKKNG